MLPGDHKPLSVTSGMITQNDSVHIPVNGCLCQNAIYHVLLPSAQDRPHPACCNPRSFARIDIADFIVANRNRRRGRCSMPMRLLGSGVTS
jgi:hypothetical protein